MRSSRGRDPVIAADGAARARALAEAVRMMDEHNVTHLVVVDRERPVGIISTLDIAGAAAWGRK